MVVETYINRKEFVLVTKAFTREAIKVFEKTLLAFIVLNSIIGPNRFLVVFVSRLISYFMMFIFYFSYWNKRLIKAITCERPLINLRLSPVMIVSDSNATSLSVNSTIEFKCRSGYKLPKETPGKAKCLINGNWSIDLPLCESCI